MLLAGLKCFVKVWFTLKLAKIEQKSYRIN